LLPPPAEKDLSDVGNWVRLRRAEQAERERAKRFNDRLARSLGNSAAKGFPLHQQRPEHSLSELRQRLKSVIAHHEAHNGGFGWPMLDPSSKFWLRDSGITSKTIVLMAHQIFPSDQPRTIEENRQIVSHWLDTEEVAP
jgi:hypothetical protein